MRTVREQGPRQSFYDIHYLEQELGTLGYKVRYSTATETTMEDARLYGLTPAVIVTDHQTAGRGRIGREWYDRPGQSVLMTIAQPIATEYLPAIDSPVLTQMFALASFNALQELAGGTEEIKIRWPNDLASFSTGKKIGGMLLEAGSNNSDYQAMLFGIGINVHNPNADDDFPTTDYGATSLDEVCPGNNIKRQDIVIGIVGELSSVLPDLPNLIDYLDERDNSTQAAKSTWESYDQAWQQASSLYEREIEITNVGKDQQELVRGRVLKTPFGGGLVLDCGNEVREILEFNSKSVLRINR